MAAETVPTSAKDGSGRFWRFLRGLVRGPWPFILPGALLYVAFNIYPNLYLFWVSMTDMQIATIFDAKWVGLDNFALLAKDPIFREVLLFTLRFVLVSVPVQFGLGLGLALLLNQKLRGRLFFRISIVLPMAISSIIVGLLWRLMLHESSAGVLNAIVGKLGLSRIMWLSNPRLAQFSILIVNLWQSTGWTTVFLLGGLQTIPTEVLEAATVDGANGWQQLIRIKLPLLRQIAGLALIFTFVGTFQIFEKILFLTNGGPGRATSTIGFRMYQLAFMQFSQGYLGRGSAIGVVMFLFILVFVILYLWLIMLQGEEQ